MALYLKDRSNYGYLHEQKIDWENLNFQLCSNYLRKVGLKVDDVKMKLGLKKIINFIEKQSSVELIPKKGILKNHQYQNQLMISQTFKNNHEEKMLAPVQQSKHLTFVSVQTSKSFADETILIRQSDCDGKQNDNDISPFGNLGCKYAVTKNDISQKTDKAMDTQQGLYDVHKLAEQNQKLGDCLKRLFSLLEDKNIIDMSKSMIKKHKKGTYSQLIDVISQNFQQYQLQIETKINHLSQYTKQLQKSLNLYNISINNRLQQNNSIKYNQRLSQSKEIQVSSFNSQQKQIQVESIKSINAQSQISLIRPEAQAYTEQETNEFFMKYNEIKNQLQLQLQKIHKYEMLIFIKDQQIESLNVIINDLQNQLQIFKKPVELSMKKTYKKFFQFTGQNLAKTAI